MNTLRNKENCISALLVGLFLIFFKIGTGVCDHVPENQQYDTISDDWKKLPTHMEFREWLLNQFKQQGLIQGQPNEEGKLPKYHIFIIEDFGDSSVTGETSNSDYSYRDLSYYDDSFSYSESESQSGSEIDSTEQSSGDSESSSDEEQTENPIEADGFIQISLDDRTVGRSDGKSKQHVVVEDEDATESSYVENDESSNESEETSTESTESSEDLDSDSSQELKKDENANMILPVAKRSTNGDKH